MTELEKVIEEQKKIFISLFGSDYNEFWTCPSGKMDLEKLIAIVKKASREEALEEIKDYRERMKCDHYPHVHSGCYGCSDTLCLNNLIDSLRNQTTP